MCVSMHTNIKLSRGGDADFAIGFGLLTAISNLQWTLSTSSAWAGLGILFGLCLTVLGLVGAKDRWVNLAVAGVLLPYLFVLLTLSLTLSQYKEPTPKETEAVVFAFRVLRSSATMALFLGLLPCIIAIWRRHRWLSLVVVPVLAVGQFASLEGALFGFWKLLVGPL